MGLNKWMSTCLRIEGSIFPDHLAQGELMERKGVPGLWGKCPANVRHRIARHRVSPDPRLTTPLDVVAVVLYPDDAEIACGGTRRHS